MIAELRELARAATPGPWVADDTTFDDGPSTGWFREGPGRVDTGEYNTLSWADATFIAACDPATITKLCDVAEAAEELVIRTEPGSYLDWPPVGRLAAALRALAAKLKERT